MAEAIKACNLTETFSPTDWSRSPDFDISFQQKFDNDQSELKLSAKYRPNFYLTLTKSEASNDFRSFKIGCDLSRKEEFEFSTSLTLLTTGDYYKYTDQLKGSPVLLGGVLWVTPYFEHESGFTGDIKTGLKLGFNHESVQTFTKNYENGSFQPLQRSTLEVTPYTGYFDMDATAAGELYTEEKVGLKFYELIGAEIGVKGVAKGSVTKEPNKPIKKCLNFSIENGMSVYASVFGSKLASLDASIVWYEKDIIPCSDGPKVTTLNPTNIGETSASSGGSITDAGGFQITARGVCWAIGDSATVMDSRTMDGSGDGSFTSQLTGLFPGTTYKLRAYVQTIENNTTHTYYGNQLAFTTTGSGTITQLKCTESTTLGSLVAGQSANVIMRVPYVGGNSGSYTGQSVVSSGVTGLTAILTPGNFANGSGTVDYTINGTPPQTGAAFFALSIGGKACTVQVTVGNSTSSCGAYIAPGVWKEFMCHNLGAANTSANPLTPSWEINGGYWQWGRKSQAAAGPTGPGASQTNEGAISGWNTTDAPNGAWLDNAKTSNDPCPSGYRVPTKAQWDGVIANNAWMQVGTWSDHATDYSSGKKIGSNLFLPAAGIRFNPDGSLYSRASLSFYWCSLEIGTRAWTLAIPDGFAGETTDNPAILRTDGLPVRCIAE